MEQLPSAAVGAIAAKRRRVPRAPPFECIALLLQGGGALGSYQAGVYAALAEAELHPDWVAGISIGAINGALIAGNAPERRVEQLRTFWEQITASTHGLDAWLAPLSEASDIMRGWINRTSAAMALFGGAPGFFTPRLMHAVARPGRRRRRHELLRNGEAALDARAPGRFRPDQFGLGALHGRRRQCAFRQSRLLRHPDASDRSRARHGERCAAARLSRRRDRGRALLGWRPRLQHAAGMGRRKRATAGHSGLPGRSLERARRFPSRYGRSRDAAEGDRLFEPNPRQHEQLQAHAKDAPCGGEAEHMRNKSPTPFDIVAWARALFEDSDTINEYIEERRLAEIVVPWPGTRVADGRSVYRDRQLGAHHRAQALRATAGRLAVFAVPPDWFRSRFAWFLRRNTRGRCAPQIEFCTSRG